MSIPAKSELFTIQKSLNSIMPPSILSRLDSFCQEEERSRSWVIHKAVDEWVKKKGY